VALNATLFDAPYPPHPQQWFRQNDAPFPFCERVHVLPTVCCRDFHFFKDFSKVPFSFSPIPILPHFLAPRQLMVQTRRLVSPFFPDDLVSFCPRKFIEMGRRAGRFCSLSTIRFSPFSAPSPLPVPPFIMIRILPPSVKGISPFWLRSVSLCLPNLFVFFFRARSDFFVPRGFNFSEVNWLFRPAPGEIFDDGVLPHSCEVGRILPMDSLWRLISRSPLRALFHGGDGLRVKPLSDPFHDR